MEEKLLYVSSLFGRLPCSKSKDHGGYDFICTHPNDQCDSLVCADCAKDNPLHFEEHRKWFIRFKDALKLLDRRLMSPKLRSRSDLINTHRQRLLQFSKHFTRIRNLEMQRLEDLVEKIIGRWSSVIKLYFRKIKDDLSFQFERETDLKLEHIRSLLEVSQKISNHSKFGVIDEFEELLHSKPQYQQVQSKFKEYFAYSQNIAVLTSRIEMQMKKADEEGASFFSPLIKEKLACLESFALEREEELKTILSGGGEIFRSYTTQRDSTHKKPSTQLQQTVNPVLVPKVNIDSIISSVKNKTLIGNSKVETLSLERLEIASIDTESEAEDNTLYISRDRMEGRKTQQNSIPTDSLNTLLTFRSSN